MTVSRRGGVYRGESGVGEGISSVSDAVADAEAAQAAAEAAQLAAEAAQLAAEAAQLAAETAETNAETAETNAETAETNAETAESRAQEWADQDEDTQITFSPGDYSAKHHAAKAAASQSAATSAKNSAEAARDLAEGYKNSAFIYMGDAQTYRNNASAFADEAEDWAIQLGTPVSGGEYSAKHHAQAAAQSALDAATFDPDDFVKRDGTNSLTGTQLVGHSGATFKTSTSNGATVVSLAPDGSGNSSSLRSYGDSDVANSPYGFFYCHETNGVIFGANKTGSASAPKISIQTNATTQLEIGTDGIAKWTQQQQGPNGSASAPTYSFTGDTDTGMYYGSSALRFAVDSSNNLAVEAGNVRAYKPLVSESASGGQFCSHRPGTAAHTLLTHSDATFRLAVSDANGTPVVNLTGWSGSTYYPIADGTYALGASSNRWAEVYAASGTINTSDAREKTPVRGMTDAEIGAAKALGQEIGVYRWLASVEEKGPAAREHIGMTVQRAIEIMESFDLDPMRYGFICHDAWEATEDHDAGDRYSFRYDELNLFLARGFEARLAALEARTAHLTKDAGL